MLAVRFVPSFVETMATKVALPKPYQVHPGTQLDGGCSNLRALVPEDAINLFLIYREIHCKHFAFKSRPMESHTSDFACTAGPVSVATRRAVAASDSSCSQLRWSTQVGATPSIPSLISRYIKQSLTRIYRVALGATDQLVLISVHFASESSLKMKNREPKSLCFCLQSMNRVYCWTLVGK